MSVGLCLSLGGTAAMVGGVSFYLASRHQMLLSHTPSTRICLMACGIAEILALIVFMQVRSAATSVFMIGTLLMAVWSFVPLLVAFIAGRRDAS